VSDAPEGWATQLPGVRVLSENGSGALLELMPDADDQAVLAAAIATGPVIEFSRRRHSLTELFRSAVSDDTVAPEGDART
jgi:ABC-2 type transport system ATP-binding protein